jgi:hypothetical protein
MLRGAGTADRKYDIHHIHKTKNDVPNLVLMIAVASKDKRASDNMMSKHLPVVFPLLLYIDDNDLLKPKSKLHKIIPFEKTVQISDGPARPHVF